MHIGKYDKGNIFNHDKDEKIIGIKFDYFTSLKL